MYIQNPQPASTFQRAWGQRYEPGAMRMLGRRIGRAFEETWPLDIKRSAEFLVAGGDPLSEEQWRQSEWFRKDVEYRPGLTTRQAEMLAERADRRRVDAFLQDRSGAAATIASYAGAFIGSIPDPLNFVPLLRVGRIPQMFTRAAGVRGGRALLNATEASVAVGAAELTTRRLEAELYQDPWDYRMAATNIGIAALIGAGFGAIVPTSTRQSRTDRAVSTAKAVADTLEGRPVDVDPVSRFGGIVPERVQQTVDAVRAHGDLPADHPLRGTMDRLGAEAQVNARARTALDVLRKEDELVSQRDLAQLRDLQITEEMRAIATGYRKAVDEGMEAITAPGLVSERQRIMAFSDAQTGSLRQRYEARMAEAIRATIPDVQRAEAVEALGEARAVAGRERGRLNEQARELAGQRRAARAEAEALEPGTPERAAAEQRATQLAEAEQAVRAQEDFYRSVEEAADVPVQPDTTVFRPPDPDPPPVESLKAAEIGEPDDTVIPLVEQRFRDLDEAGELPGNTPQLLEDATAFSERLGRMAEAVERGALCLTRP